MRQKKGSLLIYLLYKRFQILCAHSGQPIPLGFLEYDFNDPTFEELQFPNIFLILNGFGSKHVVDWGDIRINLIFNENASSFVHLTCLNDSRCIL